MNTVESVPASLDWNVYKGDTARLNLILRDQNNELMDLSDYSFSGQIRLLPKSTEILQEITVTKSDSVVTIIIEDTNNLPRTSYFDIQANNTDGTIQTFVKGTINAEDDVTR